MKNLKIDNNEIFASNEINLNIKNNILRLNKNDDSHHNNSGKNITNQYYSKNISFKYLMKYLKQSIEKQYVSKNHFVLVSVPIDYFNWIKIKKYNGTKFDLGTQIILSIANENVLVDTISELSEFDSEGYYKFNSEGYYKFNIDIPNCIFYIYHEIKLLIEPDKKQNSNTKTTDKLYNIIISGSMFKKSIPKSFFNSYVIYDHDSKWFELGKKKYVSSSGMFSNVIINKPNENLSNSHIISYQENN